MQLQVSYQPSGPQVRPLCRWVARFIDIQIFSLLILLVGELHPFLSAVLYVAMGNPQHDFLVMLAYSFVEAGLIAWWGTTPGKALLNIRLRKQDGGKLTYDNALTRTFSVFFFGYALQIPIISFICLFRSLNRLNKNGITDWDRYGKYTVEHQEIGLFRSIIILLIITSFLALAIHEYYLLNRTNFSTQIVTSFSM